MQARHKGMVGAATVVLLSLALHRALMSRRPDLPAHASVTPIQQVVPRARPIELVERIEGAFKDIYLTQISIIQGVAFGFLARSALIGPSPSAGQWLAYGTAFLVIVIVWQEYMVGSTAFTWIPTILDSVTPYIIGILQFLIIIQVRNSIGAFLLAIAVIECIGLIAYANYWSHARAGGQVNRNSYLVLGRYLKFGMAFHVLWSCPITVSLAVTYRYFGPGYELVFIAGTTVVFTPLFLHSIFNWTLPLYRLQRERRGRPGAGTTQVEGPQDELHREDSAVCASTPPTSCPSCSRSTRPHAWQGCPAAPLDRWIAARRLTVIEVRGLTGRYVREDELLEVEHERRQSRQRGRPGARVNAA